MSQIGSICLLVEFHGVQYATHVAMGLIHLITRPSEAGHRALGYSIFTNNFLAKTGIYHLIDLDNSQRFYQSNFFDLKPSFLRKIRFFYYLFLPFYTFRKIAVTLEPLLRFGCPLRSDLLNVQNFTPTGF